MILMHKVKSFNFEFIIDTKLEKYYEVLVDDEIALYRSPTNEKVYIDSRIIIEDLVTDLLLKDLEEDGIYNDLVDNIEILYRKAIIPEDVNYKFNRIRKASNNFAHPDAKTIDTPEYILILLRECLKWYLDHFKIESTNQYNDFIKPDHSQIEDYITRYKDIVKNYEELKDKYEVNLKEKEIRINELKINKDENSLEDRKKELLEARKLIRIHLNKEKEISKLINDLTDNINFLKNLIKDLKNEGVINGINRVIEDANKSVILIKGKEKNLIDRVKLLEDKVLDGIDLKENIEESDRISYEIEKDIEAVRAVVRSTSKEILDLRDEKDSDYKIEYSRYPEFYRGFLELRGDKLRNLYVILEKVNLKIIIGSKIKGKFSKMNVQKMEKFIYNEGLRHVSLTDEQIKLKLYYSLMRASKVNEGSLINEKEFKINLDIIVEDAYSALEKNKDFNIGEDKLKDLISYYLNKISSNINKKFLKLEIDTQETIVNRIFNSLEALPEVQKEDLFKRIQLADPTEAMIKSTIRTLGPGSILDSIVDRGGYASYTAFGSMVYSTLKLLGFSFPFTSYPGADKFFSFLVGPYLIQLLIDEGFLVFDSKKKKRFEIISILILNVVLQEIITKDESIADEGYEKLKETWQEIHCKYIDLNDKWNLVCDNLEAIKSIENELTEKCNEHRANIEEKREILINQKSDLKEIVLNSDRVKLLEGYFDYDKDKIRLKKFLVAKDYNRKLGLFKKLAFTAKNELRIRIVKEDIKKHENRLVDLAIENTHFRFETKFVRTTLSEIVEEKKMRDQTKEEIREYQRDYKDVEEEKRVLENQMGNIKREYFDISLE